MVFARVPAFVPARVFAFTLALVLSGPARADVGEQAAADLDLGRQLLAAKDVDGAATALSRCVDRHPAASIEADCQWELGWARWVRDDWAGVVSAWSRVRALDPGREGLDDYLAQAQDQIKLQQVLATSRSQAPATFTSTAPAEATLRVRAVGDCMIGTDGQPGLLAPDDAVGTFADVTDWLSDADLTYGNLEGPVCDTGKTSKCGPDTPAGHCYAFRSPARYAERYKAAGFDVMSTANNHAGDFGAVCRDRTEALLDAQGIAHSGRPGDVAELTVNGLKVALIGFHTSRSSHYLNDHETAVALVSGLAATHDIVIVAFHGGAEGSARTHVPPGDETFYGEDRGDLRTFTHLVVDAGADLVLGSGPHVLRGLEVYKDRLIAYSLGNFATYGPFNLSGDLATGAVLDVRMDRGGRFVGGKVLPTHQQGEGIPVKDAEGRAIDLVRSLSDEDFPGTAVQVAQDGSLAAP